MPFTPFHLGPGALFKAFGGRRFSFLIFAGAQVLMDLEVGIRMVMAAGNGPATSGAATEGIAAAGMGVDGAFGEAFLLHGWSHTLIGALLIGTVAAGIGRPITNFALKQSRAPHQPISWTAAVAGAFVGTFSHIILDAFMHADMMPWRPITDGNGLLSLVSLPGLHLFCVVCGVMGGLIILVRRS